MDPTLCGVPLTYKLRLKPGYYTGAIVTVGDAASFIKKLPVKHDGELHWSFAGAGVERAARHQDNTDVVETATKAMELALHIEGMLMTAPTWNQPTPRH
jgi:hypothetical protein